jgi:hypothetical protein
MTTLSATAEIFFSRLTALDQILALFAQLFATQSGRFGSVLAWLASMISDLSGLKHFSAILNSPAKPT